MNANVIKGTMVMAEKMEKDAKLIKSLIKDIIGRVSLFSYLQFHNNLQILCQKSNTFGYVYCITSTFILANRDISEY